MTINTQVPHPDLRDERGRTNPGLWPKSSGTPAIGQPFPAGGAIDVVPGRLGALRPTGEVETQSLQPGKK